MYLISVFIKNSVVLTRFVLQHIYFISSQQFERDREREGGGGEGVCVCVMENTSVENKIENKNRKKRSI